MKSLNLICTVHSSACYKGWNTFDVLGSHWLWSWKTQFHSLLRKLPTTDKMNSESHSVMSDSLRPHGLAQSLEFSRPEYCSGYLFPATGDLPNPGIELRSPALQDDFFFLIYLIGGLLQYCSGFCHTLTWINHGCTCVPHPEPPSHLPPHPLGSSQCTSPNTLSCASNLDWWSISHTVIYMFQCYSFKSSHPHLLPQSPKDCSVHLCLFCCLAYRVIVTIFLNSICMH